MKIFLEVVLGYMSFQKMFGYYTPISYLCTEFWKSQIWGFLQKYEFYNAFPPHK